MVLFLFQALLAFFLSLSLICFKGYSSTSFVEVIVFKAANKPHIAIGHRRPAAGFTVALCVCRCAAAKTQQVSERCTQAFVCAALCLCVSWLGIAAMPGSEHLLKNGPPDRGWKARGGVKEGTHTRRDKDRETYNYDTHTHTLSQIEEEEEGDKETEALLNWLPSASLLRNRLRSGRTPSLAVGLCKCQQVEDTNALLWRQLVNLPISNWTTQLIVNVDKEKEAK